MKTLLHIIRSLNEWILSECESSVEVVWMWILLALGALIGVPCWLAWHYGPEQVLFWIERKRERKRLDDIPAATVAKLTAQRIN